MVVSCWLIVIVSCFRVVHGQSQAPEVGKTLNFVPGGEKLMKDYLRELVTGDFFSLGEREAVKLVGIAGDGRLGMYQL